MRVTIADAYGHRTTVVDPTAETYDEVAEMFLKALRGYGFIVPHTAEIRIEQPTEEDES